MSGRGSGEKRHKRLIIEALVAAGPRKSIDAYKRGLSELCEDIAGYRALDRGVLFWICDGTSNSHELPAWRGKPGFNSRILAQDLGRLFSCLAGKALLQRRGKYDLAKRLFAGIATKWRERLHAYLAEVEKSGKLERLLAGLPQMADGTYRVQWSSTFLGGMYDERTQTLSVLNVGDSGMVVIADQPRMVVPNDERGILVAMLSRGKKFEVDISLIPVEESWEHFRGVRGFIAASDGVAKDLRTFLSQTKAAVTAQSTIGGMYTQLSFQDRLTYDDRAIITGRLVPEERPVCRGVKWSSMIRF